jgi:photosystem II stability/assembly factor-like uncharacterized protein
LLVLPLASAAVLMAQAPQPAAPEPAAPQPAAPQPAVPARLAPRALLLDATRRGGSIVAVGDRGHILVSRDSGASWTQGAVPTRALLTAVWMHDEQLGWAAGHDETILRTRDGGANWELVHSNPEAERPLLDLWFADAEHGLAIGAYGAMLATADGGTTWEERRLGEDDFHLNQIAAAADGTLFIAAEAGHLYRSGDGGATWQGLPSPYAGSFFGILPLSDGALLAFGLRGHLFRSADRGATWTAVDTGTLATLTTAIEPSPGNVVVAGLAGAVARSSDGGRTVTTVQLPDRRGSAAILDAGGAGNAAGLMLFGEGGARRLEEKP